MCQSSSANEVMRAMVYEGLSDNSKDYQCGWSNRRYKHMTNISHGLNRADHCTPRNIQITGL